MRMTQTEMVIVQHAIILEDGIVMNAKQKEFADIVEEEEKSANLNRTIKIVVFVMGKDINNCLLKPTLLGLAFFHDVVAAIKLAQLVKCIKF